MMAMDSTKITALLLILILSISSTPLTLACGSCPTPSPETPSGPILPPIIVKPPVILPPIIVKPPVILPPIIVKPPAILPPITVPPITVPPITVPPIIGGTPPAPVKPGCSPPPQTCPIDALKFGACIECLGNEIHLGDPAVQCCPLISGLSGVAAAACLCTTIKAKLLDINVYLPLVFKLLITCGNSVPPGYTCPN